MFYEFRQSLKFAKNKKAGFILEAPISADFKDFYWPKFKKQLDLEF